MSSYENNFIRSGSCPVITFPCIPEGAVRPIVAIDESVVPGSIFGCMEWIVKDFTTGSFVSHDTDELHMFVGGNSQDPENLNGEVVFQIENDKLVLTESCFVFVPKGCAHTIVSVKDLKQPMFHYVMQAFATSYKYTPAVPSEPAGKYLNNWVTKYARTDGRVMNDDPKLLTRLLWVDGIRIPGAPYTECVWFFAPRPDAPPNHVHDDMDEFVAFIGSDPEHPEELFGDCSLEVEGKEIHTTKSTIAFIPKNIPHGMLKINYADKPILHFSGGNVNIYKRH